MRKDINEYLEQDVSGHEIAVNCINDTIFINKIIKKALDYNILYWELLTNGEGVLPETSMRFFVYRQFLKNLE